MPFMGVCERCFSHILNPGCLLCDWWSGWAAGGRGDRRNELDSVKGETGYFTRGALGCGLSYLLSFAINIPCSRTRVGLALRNCGK